MLKKDHGILRQHQQEKCPEILPGQVIARITASPGADCFAVSYVQKVPKQARTDATNEPNPLEEGKTKSIDEEKQGKQGKQQTKQTQSETASGSGSQQEDSTAEEYEEVMMTGLARLPAKFKRSIWVQVGCFVVLEPCIIIKTADGKTSKITHDIVRVLTTEQLKNLHSEGKLSLLFNLAFQKSVATQQQTKQRTIAFPSKGLLPPGSSDEESDDLPPLPRGGLNARKYGRQESESEEDEDDE